MSAYMLIAEAIAGKTILDITAIDVLSRYIRANQPLSVTHRSFHNGDRFYTLRPLLKILFPLSPPLHLSKSHTWGV
jgi:hypothetical protein